MTETAKKYILTSQDIQAYLCELGIKPTEEVSIYSIEYYFDNLPSTTDKLSVEKLQERCDRYEKALTEICEFDCSDDCYFTARDALAAIGGDDE